MEEVIRSREVSTGRCRRVGSGQLVDALIELYEEEEERRGGCEAEDVVAVAVAVAVAEVGVGVGVEIEVEVGGIGVVVSLEGFLNCLASWLYISRKLLTN